ncbi:helix-turn-helix domain-containing protein [Acinetobacter haemolyticus]|uniref:helix-turn-helix domain-containing protein n=1 Tax=Acinetobacter haemolyticus TaxID=29430 RepID=UPI0013731E2C|nr:helix-turn-helix domain-containing protein [Acinetobacter haemolyticus]NAR78148.1 helix-turn-helix domain-containing protein [Acinetobacter haemolyticus]
MSIDATRWAWAAPVNNSSQRLVLLSLADRAGEEHTAWPSMERLASDTVLNLKTVKKVVTELIELGLILDTGKRTGPTGRVRILELVGVQSREQTKNWAHSNKPNIGSIKDNNEPKKGTIKQTQKRGYSPDLMNPILDNNEPKKGTIKQTQKRGYSPDLMNPILDGNEPKNGTLNEPNIGSLNLPMNLPMNLSQEHDWIPDVDQLITKIKMAGHGNNIDLIFGLPSFEFELSAFNSYFDNSGLSDSKKLHKFTAWIVDKFDRYKKQNPEYGILSPTGQQANTAQPVLNLPTKPKSLLGGPQ